ncbi:MAG: S9 family peptidase [Fimbriiglobus sp.]
MKWFVLALSVSLVSAGLAQESPVPVAPKKPYSFDFHGTKIDDPYFWMKDKKNSEVIKYLDAENAYRVEAMKPLAKFQQKLYDDMLSHIQQTDLDVPYKKNGYWYYSRIVTGQQYRIYARKKGTLESPEEVLLDVNEIAKGQKFMSAQPAGVSDDGKLFAYLTDTTGFREYYLSIKDLETGKLVEDRLVKLADFTWTGDPKVILYVTEDAAKRAHKLFRHTLGEPVAKDQLVFEEKDELYRLGIGRSFDEKYLVQTSASSTTTEQRYLDAKTPSGEWKVIAPRQEGTEYSVDHRDGLFHIRTNKDGATNFKWMTCAVGGSPKEWKDFETPRPAVFIEGIQPFKNFFVVQEREAGVPHLRVVTTEGSQRLEFPEPSYMAGLGQNAEFDTPSFRFSYTSMVTPSSVFEYDVATKARKLLKRKEVPGGFDPANYVAERIEATAPDGVKVPISIVYKKGLKKDGTAPMLLYSYGSYGFSSNPGFNETRLALLDRGVVFALAHIRGGSDLGRQWYLDGKLMKKKNTFTDFIACADHMVKEKYGSRDRLAIQGGSAGGLLIGAVVNMRPDVCKVAHLAVPFVDVINTMLDETLPLTVQEFLEWGNPKESEAGKYMLSYSPYDNLKKRDYPSILVTTSLNDSQVLFHEPTKYVAKLRTLKTDKNPLLLKCNMDAGHGGASGRYDGLREQAEIFAFLLDQIGVKE